MYKSIIIGYLILGVVCLQGVTNLDDSNFSQTVQKDDSIWVVMFSADWCGHCKALKPQFEKAAQKLSKVGVKCGLVQGGKQTQKLVNKHVANPETHMVSYPKLKVFLRDELLGEISSNVRDAGLIYGLMLRDYGLAPVAQQLQDSDL